MSIFDSLMNNMNSNGNGAGEPAAKPEVSSEVVTINALPESVDEMKTMDGADFTNPFKVAALTVCALCAYAAVPQIGIDMLNFLKGPKPLSAYDIQFLKDRFMDGKTYVPFSYFEGAVPANDYKPSEPFTMEVSTNPYSYDEDGYVKLWIRSGGADSPRHVKLRQKGNQWFLWAHESLLPDIRKPASMDPWA